MGEAPSWRRYLRFWGFDPQADIEDELSFHLAMKERELMARGVPPERVAGAVAEAFGDRERIEAELRQIGRKRQQRARRASLLDELRTDLLHAWRSFRRRPGVPLVVVLTLALGIGAGTAVFSLFDAVVLNPLAVRGAGDVVRLHEGESRLGFSYPMLKQVREQSADAAVAGAVTLSAALRAGEHAEQLQVGLVTGNWFDVLELVPSHGRLLQPADEAAPGESSHLVLSDGLWQRVFGGDPGVVGRTVWLNEVAFTVVGVAPSRFRGTSLAEPVDVWVPVTMVGTLARSGLFANPDVLHTWHFGFLDPVARLPRGGLRERALAEIRTVHAAAVAAIPPQPFAPEVRQPPTLGWTPLNEAAAARSREDLLRFMGMLAAVVVLSLAIACVNVANLMLMRSRERVQEVSVRAALGASRLRVVRQLLVESAALAALAGIAGTAVALLAMRMLSAFSLPGGIALAELSLPLDVRVLAFTAGTSVLCAIAFGLAPAVAGSRADVMAALRGGAERQGRTRLHGGSALVAAQVGMSLVLLIAASLFLRSLGEALRVDLGFRSAGVAAVSVGLRQHGYGEAEADVFIRSVLEDATRRPGVRRAAAGTAVPLERMWNMPVSTSLPAPGEFAQGTPRQMMQVTPGYLELFGIRVVRGRDIEWSDGAAAPRVALVTESMARELWPGEDALGREFVIMFGEPFRVVGVVADAHYTSLSERQSLIVLPLLQTKGMGGMDRLRLVAEGSDDGLALAALRSAVHALDPRIPTFHERSVEQHVAAVLMPQRFGSVLLGIFGGVALLIAAVGIYAVAAYDVARRHRELGIRAAIGAGRRALVGAVLRRAWAAIGVGVLAGAVLAWWATSGLQGLLFGISHHEPISYIAAIVLLMLVALCASWIPARRAAHIDPARVMRQES